MLRGCTAWRSTLPTAGGCSQHGTVRRGCSAGMQTVEADRRSSRTGKHSAGSAARPVHQHLGEAHASALRRGCDQSLPCCCCPAGQPPDKGGGIHSTGEPCFCSPHACFRVAAAPGVPLALPGGPGPAPAKYLSTQPACSSLCCVSAPAPSLIAANALSAPASLHHDAM